MRASVGASRGASGTFRYRALDRNGRDVSGVVTADSSSAALQSLSRKGLIAYEVRREWELRGVRHRVSIAQLAFALRILADLLEAGLPLSRALTVLEEVAPGSIRSGL